MERLKSEMVRNSISNANVLTSYYNKVMVRVVHPHSCCKTHMLNLSLEKSENELSYIHFQVFYIGSRIKFRHKSINQISLQLWPNSRKVQKSYVKQIYIFLHFIRKRIGCNSNWLSEHFFLNFADLTWAAGRSASKQGIIMLFCSNLTPRQEDEPPTESSEIIRSDFLHIFVWMIMRTRLFLASVASWPLKFQFFVKSVFFYKNNVFIHTAAHGTF